MKKVLMITLVLACPYLAGWGSAEETLAPNIFDDGRDAVSWVLLQASGGRAPQIQEAAVVTSSIQQQKAQVVSAFSDFAKWTEERFQKEIKTPGKFLHLDNMPEPKRSQVSDELKQVGIYVESLPNLNESGDPYKIRDGNIEHVYGVLFIPKVSFAAAVAVLTDYNHHAALYKPETEEVNIRSHDAPPVQPMAAGDKKGDHYTVFYRFNKTVWPVTAKLTAVYDIQFYLPGQTETLYSYTHSENVTQLNLQEHGLLYALDTYARFQERDGGFYLEMETISVSQSIPWYARFKDFEKMSRDSMQKALQDSARAIQSRAR